jgi:hypothetical protein
MKIFLNDSKIDFLGILNSSIIPFDIYLLLFLFLFSISKDKSFTL